ncbi:MAG: hypothetical protein ISS74_06005 [Planctomycetes bacterium]|nr:hypothetical protein [Planctomycetota bacterium]
MALPGSIPLYTRLRREIANAQDPDPAPHVATRLAEVHHRSFPMAAMRRPASGQYNCHGLTFANRRTGIYNPKDVEAILSDDGYRRISAAEAQPGDIVTCHDGTEVSHTAVITRIERSEALIGGQAVWLLSKWGQAGEYLHTLGEGPYKEHRVVFWTERPLQ